MQIFSFTEILEHARKNSAYYRQLYQHLPSSPALTDLPILDSAHFWQENSLQNNKVLTAPLTEGIVFKSGGTTGNPKFSFFSNSEWLSFTEAFGAGMAKGGLQPGERIANLFYAGDLYASFLFIMKSIEASPIPVLHLPIGGATESQNILKTLHEFQADVWAGVPTTLMKLAEDFKRKATSQKLPVPRKILFGGESFYPDQRSYLQSLFPNVQIQSIGYASVDGGLLGFVDPDCQPGEHRVFSEHTIIEIIDEVTGLAIQEPAHPGKIILTNLTRKLMPIIRYPAGDRAVWVEPESQTQFRKFRILGRSEEGARVGPVTLYYEDVSQFLLQFQATIHFTGFQMILKRAHKKDLLELRIALEHPLQNATAIQQMIIEKLLEARSALKDGVSQSLVQLPHCHFVTGKELLLNARTGKLRRIIDER